MNTIFTEKPVPPFRLDLTAWVLRRNADNIIDRWDGEVYRWVLTLGGKPAEVTVFQEGSIKAPVLQIHISGDVCEREVEPVVLAAFQRVLGTQIDLEGFYRFAYSHPKLYSLAQRFRGFKPPRFQTVFEALVNAITCQQITLSLGIRLLGRLAEGYGPSLESPSGKVYGFPRPQDLAPLEPEALRGLGFSRQKSTAMIELARDIVEKRLDLNELESLNDEQALAYLQNLRGVGRWTAEYVLLRGLGRLEIFPGDDVGARNHLKDWLGLAVLNDYPGVKRAMKPWESYGGMVYFCLLLKRLEERGFLSG